MSVKKPEDNKPKMAPFSAVGNGIPVEPGQTLQDLSQEQREQILREHENKWRLRLNKTPGMQHSLTRGR